MGLPLHPLPGNVAPWKQGCSLSASFSAVFPGPQTVLACRGSSLIIDETQLKNKAKRMRKMAFLSNRDQEL
jgi:hypothetical protein